MAAAGAAGAAGPTKALSALTAREVHLLVRNLQIDGCEAAIIGGNITGALLATVASNDDLKNPPLSLPIDDRQANRLFVDITQFFIPYGISPEDIHVRYIYLLFYQKTSYIITYFAILNNYQYLPQGSQPF